MTEADLNAVWADYLANRPRKDWNHFPADPAEGADGEDKLHSSAGDWIRKANGNDKWQPVTPFTGNL